jgi:hypothetical protein
VRERLKSNGDAARQIQDRRAKIEAICHEARKKSVDRQEVGGKTISQACFFGEINKRETKPLRSCATESPPVVDVITQPR